MDPPSPMPFLEDPRKRALEEKKLRIDHSDVHLENEKLAEALSNNLDLLARRRHRQVITRDHEIRQLRTSLSSMNVVTPPTTAAPPQITTTSTTTATVRRLKPPPTFVKLDVHVPGENSDQESEKEDSNDFDSSDEEVRRPTWWARSSPSKRTRGAWGDPSVKETEDMGNAGSGIAKHQVNKITREQLIMNNLDLNSIPTAWFTKVHQPSDVVPKRRRAFSAQPSHRSPLPTSSSSSTTSIPTPTPTRRSQSETSARPRPKRTKSAIPPTTASSLLTTPPPVMEDGVPVSALFCGGLQRQKKTQSTRSRRQLMEEMGKIQLEPAGGEALDSSRLRFLTALRRERERLDMRVKIFLQSCDRVGEGGGVSNRGAKELQSYVPPSGSHFVDDG